MTERILLDTCILVDYYRHGKTQTRKHPEREYCAASASQLIKSLVVQEAEVFVCVLTVKELLQYPNISSKEESRILVELPKVCRIVPITRENAVVAGGLSRKSAEYRNSHIEDCYIAATAIIHKLPLYTRNLKDFQYVSHSSLSVIEPY